MLDNDLSIRPTFVFVRGSRGGFTMRTASIANRRKVKHDFPMDIFVRLTRRKPQAYFPASVRRVEQFAAFDQWRLTWIPHRQFIDSASHARNVHGQGISISGPSFRQHSQSLAVPSRWRQRGFVTDAEIVSYTNLQRVRFAGRQDSRDDVLIFVVRRDMKSHRTPVHLDANHLCTQTQRW